MVLSGGTLNSGGLAQTIGTLDLEGVTTINLSGAGSGTLKFANSSPVTWGGGTLDFEGFTGGTQVQFGTDTTGLTSGQLSMIEKLNGVAGTAGLDTGGYLIMVAVPEPSTMACFGLGFAALFILRRRKV